MSKTIWLFGAFVSSVVFFSSCSSPNKCDCESDSPSSSGVGNPSSSSLTSSSSSGNYVQDQDLVKKNITLSSNDGYADIDGQLLYTENTVASALKTIDLIAYCNPNIGCKNNSIYSPWEIKLFLDNTGYLGANIFLFEIPDDQADVFKTGNKLYDILPTYNNLVKTGVISGSGVDEIPIVAGKVFFVSTSEKKYCFVIIKQALEQSVDLEIIELPFN